MKTKVGDRVGAILRADSETVHLLGYGIYAGDFPNPELGGAPNPKLTLDDGTTVWGYQVWWGPEDYIKSLIGARKVEKAYLTH